MPADTTLITTPTGKGSSRVKAMFTSGFLYISLNSAICRACSASWASLAPCARASRSTASM